MTYKENVFPSLMIQAFYVIKVSTSGEYLKPPMLLLGSPSPSITMSDDVVHNEALADDLTYIPHLPNELVHKIVSMIHSTDRYHCLLLILKVSPHSPWAVSAREHFYARVQLHVRDRYCLSSMVRSVASNGDGWQYVRSMCLL